jgi:hypothetical protein
MNAKNMAICLSPNLARLQALSGDQTLRLTNSLQQFFVILVEEMDTSEVYDPNEFLPGGETKNYNEK